MNTFLRAAIALLFSATLAVPAVAHEIKVFSSRYALPESGGKATVFLSWGHRVPVDELVDAAPIERYDLIAPGGDVSALKKDAVSLQANGVELKSPGVHTAVVTRKASVITYVIGDDGDRQMKRGPKTDHAGAAIDTSSRHQQSGKAFIVVGKAGDAAPKPVGLPFEIVPLDGPAKWVANSDIRFQVLRDGKPVTSADVLARDIGFEPDDAWSYATDAHRKGEFTIRPAKAGTWVIKVTSKQLTRGATRDQYDFDSHTATLTFEVLP